MGRTVTVIRPSTPGPGAPRSGAPRSGAPRSGAPRSGAPRSGAPRSGGAGLGAPGRGAPRSHPAVPGGGVSAPGASAAHPGGWLDFRSARPGQRIRVTAITWPRASVTATRHRQAESDAADRASSRATSAVIAPIRVSWPGSFHQPASVRQGTVSSGRRIFAGPPTARGHAMSSGAGIGGQHHSSSSGVLGHRPVLSSVSLEPGSKPLLVPVPVSASVSVPDPVPSPGAASPWRLLARPSPSGPPGGVSPSPDAGPPPLGDAPGGPDSPGPAWPGGCGSVPSSNPTNTCARRKSLPPPAPSPFIASARPLMRAHAAEACAAGRKCPDRAAVPLSSPLSSTRAFFCACDRRRSAAAGSTEITARCRDARSGQWSAVRPGREPCARPPGPGRRRAGWSTDR